MAVAFRTRVIAVVATAAVALALLGAGVVRASDARRRCLRSTADRLLANAATALARPVTISGDVETHLDLGLPEVPAGLGGEGGPIAMVGGTQRFRVWHSSEGMRVAHITQVSERDLVVNRREAWWWDAATMEATKISFSDLRVFGSPVPWRPRPRALKAPSRWIRSPRRSAASRHSRRSPRSRSNATGEVAGRDVYDLVLTPLTDRTLIGSIEVAIDAETWLPLRFQVIARSTDDAAMSVGFTSVSYDAIDPGVFEFSPPTGYRRDLRGAE